MNELPKRLKIFRKRLNLTQGQLAEAAGTITMNVSRYERGEYEIPIDFVKSLHREYKLSYTWFFEGTGSMFDREENKRTTVTDIKEMKEDVEAMKAKLASLEKSHRELHANFWAAKATGK